MPSKPRLLDLFCGAGGAAMGYHRAGFEVVGVDIEPQPRYPFRFWHLDALALEPWVLAAFDAIHASPPCPRYSAAANLHGSAERHPDLIAPVRVMLERSGKPWVIENVPRSPLRDPHTLCGLALGLNVKRHRLFETTFPLLVPPCPGGHPGAWVSVFGGGALTRTPKGGQARVEGRHNGRGAHDGRVHVSHAEASLAMEIDWMSRDELSDAIPSAYTELIGHQLQRAVCESLCGAT